MDKLDQILTILKEQGETLQEHSKMLKEQRETLQEHSKFLNEQGETLQEHSKMLKEQRETLQEHSKMLNEQGETLQEHSQLLKGHGVTLREHGQILRGLRHGQEVLKVRMDSMDVKNVKEFDEIKGEIRQFKEDLNYMMRKTLQNEKDILDLKSSAILE